MEKKTNPQHPRPVDDEAAVLALRALAWLCADEARAERFLALTGLTPEQLRGGAGTPSLNEAVLGHLCGHEPDLLDAAAALGVEPGAIVAASGARWSA
ncbi:DUF3572 family protein [Erythrobacteraceae bacterium CFH 75059]|uniref:DUF3572 family protein n=1 Tax=Qipengyuania thermophila TaxID=2509361 RepID=UPI001020B1D7|nr:DUF3572 family protein [Qipengyuania thermophila]TCD06861.1 DUF3572 family protein [Erythrobacteraceae bacterium CFH 75059]